MKIRSALSSDVPSIATLCDSLGYPASEQTVARRLERVLGDGRHALFVAEGPEGEIAGWVHICERLLVIAGRQAAIEGLVVGREHRRRGMGRLLMERAEQWARARDCTEVKLRSNVERQQAREFYEGIGYVQVSTQRAYLRELADGDSPRSARSPDRSHKGSV